MKNISVALIPPVVLVGIVLSRGDWSLFESSLDIALVNVIGIILGSF